MLILIVSAATLLLSMLVSVWLSSFHNLRFPSLGAIIVTGVEAHGGNITVTQNGKQFIEWGTVYPGSFTNRSFYIKSISNIPVKLNLTISNITFQNSTNQNVTDPSIENSSPLTLTWNYDNTPLNPKAEIYVTLTLHVSDDPSFINFLIGYCVTGFSFDMVIKAI
ncbi:MAG: hypothetical protein QW270_04665 [Candidatus Bathyarchaeia archaeon]